MPTLFRASEKPPFWITPLKVVELLSFPAVKTAPCPDWLVTVPVPLNEPTWLALPLRSNVPSTVNAEFGLNPVAVSARNVAPLTILVVPHTCWSRGTPPPHCSQRPQWLSRRLR